MAACRLVSRSFIWLVAFDVTLFAFFSVLTMPELNTAPTFDNLPSAINVLETAGGGTVIQTLTVTDAEGDPTDTVCSVSPVDEAYKFVFETDPGAC